MPLNRRELLGLFRDPSVLSRRRPPDSTPARITDLDIDTSLCLAWQDTLCMVCLEACPEGAIRFLGLRNPTVVKDACTLCGDCVPVCPAKAFTVGTEPGTLTAGEEEGGS